MCPYLAHRSRSSRYDNDGMTQVRREDNLNVNNRNMAIAARTLVHGLLSKIEIIFIEPLIFVGYVCRTEY